MIRKILQKTFIAAILVLSVACASTGRQIPHPPSYNDFVKLQVENYNEMNADYSLRRIELISCLSDCSNADDQIDEKTRVKEIRKKCIKNESDARIVEEIEQNLEFKKALQFTAMEMHAIKKSANLNTIVGAGIQSDIDESFGVEHLESASVSESPTGLALASLIDRYFALQAKETDDISLAEKLRANIAKLIQKAPDNALSFYLNGYWLHKDQKDDEALHQLREGNTKEEFSNYSKERFYAVVQAAESIGYSQFTARQHAINFSSPGELYSKMVALCKALIATDKSKDARKECLSMGVKVESASRSTFEKLQGLIIQSLAYRGSSDPKDVELMSKIIDRQKTTLENGSNLLKIPFSEIPEAVWLQYFEIYFAKDEKTAGSYIEDYYSKTRHGNYK